MVIMRRGPNELNECIDFLLIDNEGDLKASYFLFSDFIYIRTIKLYYFHDKLLDWDETQ